MTQEEFIKILEEKGYTYGFYGNRIVVTHFGSILLESLETLPPGVIFANNGDVLLDSLQIFSGNAEFENKGGVYLSSLHTIPGGIVFNNGGFVMCRIPKAIQFKNKGSVYLHYLNINTALFKFKVEGISSKRLLNKMISLGIFDKESRS
jgi:hypothetical protein